MTGRIAILDVDVEIRPEERFYGIGDHDDTMRPAAPVDPRVDPTATETFVRLARDPVSGTPRVIGIWRP